MPEGDTIYRSAATLDAGLSGSVAGHVGGSAAPMRRWARRLTGRRVESVESMGKHLLIWFQGDLGVRTHLGMSGAWHLYRPHEAWGRSPGSARVVIETDEWVAVCFAAPVVAVGRRPEVLSGVDHLGPDLMSDDVDLAEVLTRIEGLDGATPAADVLMDQRVMAGIGNVIKSETLFLEQLHPLVPLAGLASTARKRMVATARRLLHVNREGGRRVTTGTPRRGRELWVYDRAGKACRRCGAAITMAHVGSPARVTYWCGQCQPEVE